MGGKGRIRFRCRFRDAYRVCLAESGDEMAKLGYGRLGSHERHWGSASIIGSHGRHWVSRALGSRERWSPVGTASLAVAIELLFWTSLRAAVLRHVSVAMKFFGGSDQGANVCSDSLCVLERSRGCNAQQCLVFRNTTAQFPSSSDPYFVQAHSTLHN